MDNPTELPDDVLEYLKERSEAGGLGAWALLEKYTSEPKTLADYGTVTYTRRWRGHDEPMRWHNQLEDITPDGVQAREIGEFVPWPDDGGICRLLNDGWRLVPSDMLDSADHELHRPRSYVPLSAPPGVLTVRGHPVTVLAREIPQEDEA